MTRAERVVDAFTAIGKARQTPTLAQGQHLFAPTGKDLVRITLVPDIPYQPVIRGVKNMMQGDRQLDDAKAGAQMATRNGDNADRVLAQFIGQLAQFFVGKIPDIGGF